MGMKSNCQKPTCCSSGVCELRQEMWRVEVLSQVGLSQSALQSRRGGLGGPAVCWAWLPASAGLPCALCWVRCCEEVPSPLLQVRYAEGNRWVSGPRLAAPDLSSRPRRALSHRGVRWCPPTVVASCGHVPAQPHSCLCPAGLPGFCVVWRVPGGLVVGRSLPHPLRTHPDPQGAAATQEGSSTQAAVAPAGWADPLERQRWRLRLGLACGDCFSGRPGCAAF